VFSLQVNHSYSHSHSLSLTAAACELVSTAFSAFVDRFANVTCTSNANALVFLALYN
jgi:hypothetical protein